MERCEDAISSLMQEIAALKDEYKENQRQIATLSKASVRKSLGPLQEDNSESNTTVMMNVNTQLAHGDMEVKFFRELTGIEILQYVKSTEQKPQYVKNTDEKAEKVLCGHKLAGKCRFLPFEVTFHTTETQRDDGWVCDVIQVKVHMDCKANEDVAKLVERTETTKNLQGFFRTLSKYAEWCEFRAKTFTHFNKNYAAAVRLPYGSSGNSMVLVNPELPMCEMILVWEITINERGAVIPLLDLLPKVPEEAVKKSAVLEDAAPAFKNLLQLFGIQGSIEKVIHSFCLKRTGVNP